MYLVEIKLFIHKLFIRLIHIFYNNFHHVKIKNKIYKILLILLNNLHIIISYNGSIIIIIITRNVCII